MADSTTFDAADASTMMTELRSAFAAGRTSSYEWRVEQLKAIHRMIEEREQEIIEALRLDLNKPVFESVLYEIVLVKNNIQHAIKELKQWMKPEKVKTTLLTFPSSAEIVSDPLGVVLVISAWNFPIVLSLDPVIGAIAAGNAVVLKPSEIAPSTSLLLAKYMREYMDNSAIRVVEGGVPETTLLLEQRWDKIFYTGNGKVGRIVMAAAAKHLTPVALELGGKCPVIVDSDVDLKIAAKRIALGKWGFNNGQTCVTADHIITTKEFAPKLRQVDAMKQCLEEFYGTDPLSSKDISRIVSPNHFDRLSKLLDDDKVSGKIVFGGQRDKAQLKISPTLLLDVPEDALIMNDEIFGPLLPIVTVERLEESFKLVNSRPKPLAAYLFTNNKKLMVEFANKIYAGGICINDIALHISMPTLPFGGVGESGIGGYHGKFSFEAFSHKKSVLYKSFMGDAAARYPPYMPWKLELVKSLLTGSLLGVIKALFGFSDQTYHKEKTV
ncbi:hypothetical protein V2J09_023749 [Rumex salicifolius]